MARARLKAELCPRAQGSVDTLTISGKPFPGQNKNTSEGHEAVTGERHERNESLVRHQGGQWTVPGTDLSSCSDRGTTLRPRETALRGGSTVRSQPFPPRQKVTLRPRGAE